MTKKITGYDAQGKVVYEATPPPGCMFPVADYIKAAQRYYGAVRVSATP